MDQDFPRLLLFLRYYIGGGSSSFRFPVKLYSLFQSITQHSLLSCLDHEGWTVGQLMAQLQRNNLQACRPTPNIIPQQPSSSTVVPQPPPYNEEEHASQFRSRGSSFDHLLPPDDDDEPLSQHHPENKSNLLHGCEVISFGQTHHPSGSTTTSTSTSNHHHHHPSTSDKTRPQRVQFFAPDTIGRDNTAVAVAAAPHHTLVVTKQGHLYAFGWNKMGRLGTGTDRQHHPIPVRVLKGLHRQHIVAVAAAESHSLCVTRAGTVYAWGSNRFGQLGLGNETSRNVPRRVEDLQHVPCVQVAAGEKHSVALSKQGEIYVWGENAKGQLGVSRRNGCHKVQRVESLWNTGKRALEIAAADFSTLVLVAPSSRTQVTNSVFSWGHGNHVPTRIQFPASKRRPINPVKIDCAKYHNVAISSDGMVYTWGLHAESLGTNPSKGQATFASPQLVTGMLPENGGGFAVAVSASEHHTAAVTDTGALYTWGATSGENVLGHEGVRFQPDPRKVPGVCRAVGVSAAKQHTMLLIGVTFPPVPKPTKIAMKLDDLAARVIASHVDLFNILPILITAERAGSYFLVSYCHDFISRNLDGVLNVAQRSMLDTYLNEQLTDSLFETSKDRDLSYHPLILDFLECGSLGNCYETRDSQNFVDWLPACEELAKRDTTREIIRAANAPKSQNLASRDRIVSIDQGKRGNVGARLSCSTRCLELTEGIDLSSKASAEFNLSMINKETRGVKKKLNQIARLQEGSVDQLTLEQREKIARRPQLEADLSILEPAIDHIKKRISQLIHEEIQGEVIREMSEEKETKISTDGACLSRSEEVSSIEAPNVILRCDACNVRCSDERSYQLHVNGKKHRNRLHQLEMEEEKKITTKLAFDAKFPSKHAPISHTDHTKNSSSKGLSDTWPPYSLPPPPHHPPDYLVTDGGNTPGKVNKKSVCLSDIMKEEESKKLPAIRVSAPPTVQLSLRLPNSQNSQSKLPSWLTSQDSRSAASTPSKSIADNWKAPGSISLSDFMSPSQSPAPSTPGSASWASPGAATSAKVRRQTFTDIQKEELDFKSKEDQTFGSNGKWFIERRERAGSLREIQKIEEEERQHQLLVEEQLRIEKQIQEDLESQKRSKKPKGKKKNNSSQKQPAKKPAPATASTVAGN